MAVQGNSYRNASLITSRTQLTAASSSATISAVLAAPLGALTATATATPTVAAVLAAPLGSLTASASATPTVSAVLAAPLGGLTASITATVTTPRRGGNLTKGRLHLGNSPGPKQHIGQGRFLYRLTISGAGSTGTGTTLGLPRPDGTGELLHAGSFVHPLRSTAAATIATRTKHTLIPARTYVGVASEDLAELVFLGLVDEHTVHALL